MGAGDVDERDDDLQDDDQPDDEGDDEDDDEEAQEVDKLLAKRSVEGVVQFKVLWSSGETSWHPQDLMDGAQELIAEFEATATKGGRRIKVRKAGGAKTSRRGVGARFSEDRDVAGMDMEDTVSEMRHGISEVCSAVATLANLQRKGPGDEEDKDFDGKLPGTRALLGGDKRVKEVGVRHFKAERGLKRTKRNTRMDVGQPFAEEYNKTLELLLDLDSRLMECELRADKAQSQEEIMRYEVRGEMLDEEWVALDDKLELIQDCSDTARSGKIKEALQVYEDAESEQRQTGRTAELERRHKAARRKLKDNESMDQAEFIAQSLGVKSAWMGGVDGDSRLSRSLREGMTGALRGYGAGSMGGYGSMSAGGGSMGGYGAGAAGGSAASYPAATTGGGLGYGLHSGQSRPLPGVGIDGSGKGGKGSGKGGKGRTRTFFRMADEVLGAKCPQVLKGVFVPVGMTFHTTGKTLKDGYKVRTEDFNDFCKMCGKAPPAVKGHEAFECMEDCQWNGQPAMGARRVYQLNLGVINEHGEWQ